MKAYEPCDACHAARARVWWVGIPTEPAPEEYGWLDLALCGHCSNLHRTALEALGWHISVEDDEFKDYFRPRAQKVPVVHVS